MTHDKFLKTDIYLEEKLLKRASDPVFVLDRQKELDIPPMAVSPLQGAFLKILAESIGASRILELGTLAGYSTIWLARALPENGKLISLELFERNVRIAREHVAEEGLSHLVDIRGGEAEISLNIMLNDGEAPFDLIFLDADKVNYPLYLERIMGLVRRGTLIIADNVVRNGDVSEANSEDPSTCGVRTFFNMVEADNRLEASALQTVGSKGHDGFAVIRVVR